MTENMHMAPLRLAALTLRGIGSYLHGARLELRPLTILCGKNGSGKSTWLRVLDMLDRSRSGPRFPFAFDIDDSWCCDIQLTNACVYLSEEEVLAAAASDPQQAAFGPLGTIGLEMQVDKDFQLEEVPGPERPGLSPAADFLWNGRCQSKLHVRIRVCHPSHWTTDAPVPSLRHMVELTVGNRHIIRFGKPRDREVFKDGQLVRITHPYAVECSRSFFVGASGDNSDLVSIGELPDDGTGTLVPDPTVDRGAASEIGRLAIARMRQVLGKVLDSYFHIGAIRPAYRDMRSDSNPEPPSKLRYVGAQGESMWSLERQYMCNVMRQPRAPHLAVFPQRFKEGELDSAVALSSICEAGRGTSASPEKRIWEMAPPEMRDMATEADALDAGIGASVEDCKELDRRQERAVIDLLNSLLPLRELYMPQLWDESDDEVQYLVKRGIRDLADDEVIRLNRLLLEGTLLNMPWPAIRPKFRARRYTLDAFVSVWCQKLTGTSIGPASEGALPDEGWEGPGAPNGFLIDPKPHQLPDPKLGGAAEDPEDLAIVSSACFGGERQIPRNFSSGFHQLAPIVVQAGLVQANEIIALENPEVHLHPGLQLATASFLLQQALAGKMLIIETHSDLMIRRTLRAISKEEDGLSQEQVRIYFTSLIDSGGGFQTSVLKALEVNIWGQISNWPEGFMDDDVREARELLDWMYGANDA